MRIAALLVAAALIAGCANAAVGVGTGAAAGTSATAGAASASTTSGAAALGIVLIFGAIDYMNNPQPFPDPASLMSPNSTRAVPELARDRRISEQDCSKPVDLTLGNLRCK
jgi:hypothetical protein